MAGDGLILRTARPEDVKGLAHLESDCWPGTLAASEEQIAARLAAYSDGQWVAETSNRLLGYSSAQRIDAASLSTLPLTYGSITDLDRFTATHAPEGSLYQLVGVSCHPSARGQRIGRQLVDLQITRGWSLPGVHSVLGFTRPTGRHLSPGVPLDDYVSSHEDGSTTDPTLSFHTAAGAVVLSHHENFRPNDHESLGSGVLISYPRPIPATDPAHQPLHGRMTNRSR